jgi:transcriptional regulator with GAF, ATPase, and Fis domain
LIALLCRKRYGHFLQKGLIELADGGTLFLDEIGDLSLSIQKKFLRFLQERTFTRLGGTKLIKVDIRIIAATNKNLKEEIISGNFRAALYYHSVPFIV